MLLFLTLSVDCVLFLHAPSTLNYTLIERYMVD